MSDLSDPQSYCPFCKRTHDAPEFIETLKRIAKLEAAAKKTISEFIDEDADHSAACMNWALCEHSQHQCGLCDLRAALEQANEQ